MSPCRACTGWRLSPSASCLAPTRERSRQTTCRRTEHRSPDEGVDLLVVHGQRRSIGMIAERSLGWSEAEDFEVDLLVTSDLADQFGHVGTSGQ